MDSAFSCGGGEPAPRSGRARYAVLASLALLAAGDAQAVDCVISTTGVAFGVYDPTLATSNDSTGNVTVTCSYVSGGGTQVAYSVALSPGASGTYAQRQLRAGPAILNYNLFDSATRTRVWGNGTAGTGMVSGSVTVGPGQGNNTRQETYPIYGRIPAQQNAGIGNYGDTILVTLTF
jgi:spore coat protein U-like protein